MAKKKSEKKTNITWTKEMQAYLFKRLYQLMGPLMSYVQENGGHQKEENEAFEKIAKELTVLFDLEVTLEKVMMNVYKTIMLPVLNPRQSQIEKLAAAFESRWLTNKDISRAVEYYEKQSFMIDLGNYYAIKKVSK